jgi:enoyl-CoA hydratase/carnithine racemase
MELDELQYTKLDGVAEIVLNRPEVLNALSARPGGTRDQLLMTLADAEADPAVGCVMLRGAGTAFCAGADLTGAARRDRPADDVAFLEEVDRFHDRLRASAVPVIAAVHGYCLGAGLNLAASCDLVIAGEDARFGFPEGRIGLVGATGFVGVIGRPWAKYLILTGELLSAAQAQAIGLVLTVEPSAVLVDRVFDLARRVARMPRAAALLNRRAIDAVADASGEAAGRLAARAHDAITLSMAGDAAAPDGRRFREILDDEGIPGMKAARAAQYTEPWLRDKI